MNTEVAAGEPCGARLPLPGGACLSLIRESEAAELQAVIEANRDRLVPWLPWAARQTTDDTLGFIRASLAQLANNDGFQTAVVRDGRIVGVAGFREVDWDNRRTSLGYWLAAEEQGRGTMTAAVRLLTDHALTAWKLDRVEIRAAVENRRSRAVPERLGFALEAIQRRAESVGGRQLDCAVYAAVS
jgi:ribosomal-protein-serine acetyltransferase